MEFALMQQIMSITGRAALSAQDEISGQVLRRPILFLAFDFFFFDCLKIRYKTGGSCIMNTKSHRRNGSH